MWLRILLIVALAWGAYDLWSDRSVDRPPGVIVAAEPVQRELDAAPRSIVVARHTLTPVAHFAIDARVLSRSVYRFDRGARLAPVDLALGWGPMSDSAVLDAIKISQSGRAYFWRTANFPIPRRAIEQHSANMHLIAADPDIARRLRRVRVGQVVAISGYLVDARAADGGMWRSSRTREDTGMGACELIYVTSLAVGHGS